MAFTSPNMILYYTFTSPNMILYYMILWLSLHQI